MVLDVLEHVWFFNSNIVFLDLNTENGGPGWKFFVWFQHSVFHSNIFTVQMILNSAKMRTTLCCFHLLNSVLSNIKVFSLTSAQSSFLFNGHIFCLSFQRRVEELQHEVESREPVPPPVEADLETHLGSDATNRFSLSPPWSGAPPS